MSTSVADTLPIGPVQAYWGDARLGSMRSQVNFRYNKETVQQRLEDSPNNVSSFKTVETMEVDVVVADLKMSQLRRVYDQAQDYSNRSTLEAEAYKASTSSIVFFGPEELKLTGTGAFAVDQALISETGTVIVLSTNFATEYVKGTDYQILNAAAGTIGRLGGGSITDGETVYVYYKAAATNAVAFVGGKMADIEASLRIVHRLESSGKHIQFYAPRVKKIGASEIAIQMQAEFGGMAMTFHCLADMSQTPGRQLFYWSKEA